MRNSLGLKAPRGFGWFTNPRRAAYNRIYNRTTKGCGFVLLLAISIGVLIKFLLTLKVLVKIMQRFTVFIIHPGTIDRVTAER